MKKAMKRTFLTPEPYLQVNIAKVSLNIPTFQYDYPCMKYPETEKLYDTKTIQNLVLLVNLNTGIHTD